MIFLYSAVLFFILIPIIFLFYLIVTKTYSLEKYFSKKTLEKLSIQNNYFSKKTRNIILLFSLIFMVIALARPVIDEKKHSIKQEVISLIIALDVSKSMKVNDIYPNRLEFAKNKALKIIEEANDFSIGIILFAKSSFLISPLTQDLNSLKILLKNFDTGMNFDNGTNIYSSLELTTKLLKDYKNKNLLILSDGGDKKEFKEEIEYAKEHNISIYTLNIGTKKGGVIKTKSGDFLTNQKGDIVNLKINEKIKDLSLQTNGGYIQNTINNDDIKSIIKDIKKRAKTNKIEEKNYKTYTELFYYPLSLAIFLLFIGFSSLPKFKKKQIVPILILSLFFITPDKLDANIFDFKDIKEANEAYKKADYEKANKKYSQIYSKSVQKDYNLANTLYKQKKYKEAIKKYKSIKSENTSLQHKILHNLGNSYVKDGKLGKAIKSYKEALRYKNDKETKENLEAVKKYLENQRKKQNNKQDNNNKNKQDEKKKNQDKKSKQKQQEKKNNKKEDKSKQNKQNKENKQAKKQDMKKYSQKDISDKEEKKWIKKLENKKTGVLIKKFKSSKEDEIQNPW